MRDSFVFYRSFAEALRELDPKSKAEVLDAIIFYALDGEEPKCTGISKAIFSLVRPQIDANNRRYENGRKGGRPKTEIKPNENQEKTKPKPNVNENVNVNENENENYNENAYLSELRSKVKPPTKEQVEARLRDLRERTKNQ